MYMDTSSRSLVLCTLVLAACHGLAAAGWSQGTATFYGDADGSGTMGGACGYGNLYNAGYGINNAALSQTLFNDGASCGQCYLITCDASRPGGQYCRPGSNSVTVSATNLCPPNYGLPGGGWCGPGRPHFDMSQPAWERVGVVQGGIVPVLYQQVACARRGGVRFAIAGSAYYLLVNIQNVGGSGSVKAASVKGDRTAGWVQMSRNWGANWQALSGLVGQGLSFAVTTTGGQYLQFLYVVPGWWQFGMTFATNQNFAY
ncbi:expansin-A31 [Zea mays]|uniref:Expansin n=1 Tax=Zea mays TaxID=4577 RepID=A0A1D6KUP3_MAIZE|nr:expansin-A31 [Zea mays]ONM06283.1 Expansin-A11 [Zea mays]|eukprot:XP_020402361.1 expansin-A31 [Zea mays]